MDTNKYSYFLDQCNKTPLSKDWRDVFGLVTEDTVKQFHFDVKNPQDYKEALKLVELLNNRLKQQSKYCDQTYKEFLRRGEIPKPVHLIISELLKDNHLCLLIAKERAGLGIPVVTGLELKDPSTYGEHELSKAEEDAVTKLTLYAALTTNVWRKFFSYLLLFNYVIPITFLEIQDLAEIVEPKSINKLALRLFENGKVRQLKKRQIDLLVQMSITGKETIHGLVSSNYEPQDLSEKVSRITKLALNSVFKEIYPKNRKLTKSFDAVKKRRSRIKNKNLQQLKKLTQDAQKISPIPPKIEMR